MPETTPDEFIAKWKGSALKERSAARQYVVDLYRPLNKATPTQSDLAGSWYCFERRAVKTTGGDSWADVCERGHRVHYAYLLP